MPPATNEEQFRFLISCIRWSNNGRVDFQEVANECHVVSKGAAAKRYERMMRAHGIHPNGGPAVPTETLRSPGVPRARQSKAARDGGDRYGKGKKSDKAKQKQAQFDEERDMDMDDEEESSFSSHHQSSSVKGEHLDHGDDGVPTLAVKAEQRDDAYETDEYASPSPAQARFASLAVAQNDGSNSPRSASHKKSVAPQFEVANAADAAYLARWTPQPSFGMNTYSSAAPSYGHITQNQGTLPAGGFDFNNYTPRQHTPTPFFPGTREPEEVQPAEGTAAGGMDGSGSPSPSAQNGGKVINLD